jgi:D-alanyl-D-alanine carboxypeptidase
VLTAGRIQQLVEDLAARRRIPHAVLVVERGDGSMRWSHASGSALPDGTPMTVDTPFFIASIDKTFLAALVLQLHERGVFSIDGSIAACLPRALIQRLHVLGGEDRTERITIRNLLGHTSGLADYLEDYPPRGVSLIQRLIAGDDCDLPLELVLEVVRDQLTPHFPPQRPGAAKQRVRYSDTNYQLLRAVVEHVTARPLHEVMTERILEPAGLRHTWYAGRTAPPDPTVAPAIMYAGEQPLVRPRLLASLGSIYSTAADLIRFMRTLLRGELFRDAATLRLMQERWNRFGFPLDRGALRAPGWPIEYALGIKRFRLPRLFTPLRPVPAVIGHTGSTGTWLFHAAEPDLFIAGAVNQVTAGAVPYRLVPQVLRSMERA